MTHKAYLALALPLTITTITTPLLGAVDTAVVGHMSDPAYIAAVAVGTIIFNTMYWLFGFLRVSTTGFATQAHGAEDKEGMMLALIRPLLIALLVGITLIILQWSITRLFLPLLTPDQNVQSLATEYFSIRIWGAPFGLLNYVIIGWLMGMLMIKKTLFLQLYLNLTNIVLDLFFVIILNWGVPGVASATLISEVTTFVIGLIIVLKVSPFELKVPSMAKFMNTSSFKKMMQMNRDLFIRTFCLLIVFNLLTAKGASFGTEILAANAILIQIHFIMAYLFDGFANASSIMAGRAIGSRDHLLYNMTVRLSCQWAVFTSLIIAGAYYLFDYRIFRLFTKIPEVLEEAQTYQSWILLFPLLASFGIVLHGLYVGSTEAAPIRNSMIYALILFLMALFLTIPSMGNHGLWFAFILFSVARSFFLLLFVPGLQKKLFPSNEINDGKKEKIYIGMRS